jgi:dihydrolipoamide dehydrogenase
MDENTFDLVVIGGGPAGYVGAIRAAQLGLKTACVERERLGGVCLNWGCIPTKALLAEAEFYARLKNDAPGWGILADNIRHDWSKIIGRSRGVADRMNKGIAALFKKNKVTHILGHARIVAAGPNCRVEVHDRPDHLARTLSCKYVLVSTGAGPRELPGAPFDGQTIINYREAMTLPEQPKTLVVIGAGAIGMEFAYFYNAFGTKVTVVEMLDRVLPNEDPEVSAVVMRSFRKQGIDCRVSTRVMGVKKTDAGVEVTIAPVNAGPGGGANPGAGAESAPEVLTGDKVLVAIGVRGKFDGLLADNLKLETSRDHIKIDKATYATSLPGVFAVGDVIGPPWLAHVASEEAIICVETIAGHHPEAIDYAAIPGCTYCLPQVASLGATEPELQKRGLKAGTDYKVGKFPFQASGKAQALGTPEGFVKLLTDVRTGEILGVHMVGESVTELLAEMGLAKRLEATSNELIATMHAHPTLSEAIHEAALSGEGRAINY